MTTPPRLRHAAMHGEGGAPSDRAPRHDVRRATMRLGLPRRVGRLFTRIRAYVLADVWPVRVCVQFDSTCARVGMCVGPKNTSLLPLLRRAWPASPEASPRTSLARPGAPPYRASAPARIEGAHGRAPHARAQRHARGSETTLNNRPTSALGACTRRRRPATGHAFSRASRITQRAPRVVEPGRGLAQRLPNTRARSQEAATPAHAAVRRVARCDAPDSTALCGSQLRQRRGVR